MPLVVPVTIAILPVLSWLQRRSTAFICNIFGPIMLMWFVAIGLLGLGGIARTPGILAAISPYYALSYLLHAVPVIGFAVLGVAFLAVTGGEAMYADIGRFGRPSILPKTERGTSIVGCHTTAEVCPT
jgi:KUP system potassium uptake protein